MLGPLEHHRPRAPHGRGARRRQSGRPATDDGNIPFITITHTASLGDHAQPAVRPPARALSTEGGGTQPPLYEGGGTQPPLYEGRGTQPPL